MAEHEGRGPGSGIVFCAQKQERAHWKEQDNEVNGHVLIAKISGGRSKLGNNGQTKQMLADAQNGHQEGGGE
ncbi:MAG: hypothetical protein ACYDIB_13290 [Desulfobulbia bacterium]